MRGFVAILRREVFERRLIVLLALALGLIAVVAPLLPGARSSGVAAADLRGGVALGLASLLTALLAIFLGGSIIAGDLVERRLGFYFSRPIPGWAVWAGKMAAALLLIFGGGILVLVPAALLGGNLSLDGTWGTLGRGGLLNVTGPGVLAAWALVLLLLLLTSHAASVIVRARSPWALLDLAALAVCGGLAGWSAQRLGLEGVFARSYSFWSLKREDHLGIIAWMELGLLLALLLALAVAGALQVVRGRTDPRRAHRVLSQGLWGMLLTSVLLFTGLAVWVLAAGPNDLRGIVEATEGPGLPGEHWIAFSGPAAWRPGYNPSFLYDLDSGRAFRTRSGLVSFGNVYGTFDTMVRFSADGRRVVWLEYDGAPFASPVVLHWLDLGRPGATPVRTPVSYRTVPRGFALSPDGRRVAAYEWPGNLTVSEVENGRLLAAPLYDSRYGTPRLAFAGPDRLRIFDMVFPGYVPGRVGLPVPIFEVDLTTRSPRPLPTGEVPASAGDLREWSFSPEGDRILLRSGNALGLFDASSGMPLATLGSGSARGTFLRDGRIAVVETLGDKYEHELRIFPTDGHAEPRRFPFPNTIRVIVADQPAPGLLRVVTHGHGAPPRSHELWRVDLERGAVQPLGTRRLAGLDLPLLPRSRVDLKGVDGVVWLEPWTSRARVVLKGS